MGQQEIEEVLEKEKIMTINEFLEILDLAKRSLQQSLSRMIIHHDILMFRIKNKRFYVEKDGLYIDQS